VKFSWKVHGEWAMTRMIIFGDDDGGGDPWRRFALSECFNFTGINGSG